MYKLNPYQRFIAAMKNKSVAVKQEKKNPDPVYTPPVAEPVVPPVIEEKTPVIEKTETTVETVEGDSAETTTEESEYSSRKKRN